MLKVFYQARDPLSSYTHFIGAVFYGIAGIIMIVSSIMRQAELSTVLSLILFTIALVALYVSSCIYHYIPLDSKHYTQLRKLDHSMIFVLIAGTYTPIVIAFYPPDAGTIFLLCIWTIAVFGIVSKLFWLNAPRMLSTLLYLLLGWALIFYFKPILNLPVSHIFYLLIGGIFYSVGAVIYAFKKPNFSKKFGFHELFHIFVLLGSLFHFLFVDIYIV